MELLRSRRRLTEPAGAELDASPGRTRVPAGARPPVGRSDPGEQVNRRVVAKQTGTDGSLSTGSHRFVLSSRTSPIPPRPNIKFKGVLPAAVVLVLAGVGSPTVAGASAASRCADAHLRPTRANVARIDAATLCLIDRERTDRGLTPLRRDARLDAAAQIHVVEMVVGDYFDHLGTGGQTPVERAIAAGYRPPSGIGHFGENIAAAGRSLATPAASVASWMRSPTHRAQILDPSFRDTGIAVTAGVPASLGMGRSGATYAEEFGTGG